MQHLSDNVIPIFILGAPRSGSSALRAAFSAGGIPGFPEGHLLALAAQLAIETSNFQQATPTVPGVDSRFACAYFDYPEMIKSVADIFAQFFEARLSSRVFVDKTPGAKQVRHAIWLWRLFPKAKFIFLHRHPIESLRSAKRKFGNSVDSAEYAADWRDCANFWQDCKQIFPANAVELSHSALQRSPELALEQIRSVLGIELGQKALDVLKGGDVERTDYYDGYPEETLKLDERETALYDEYFRHAARKLGYSIGNITASTKPLGDLLQLGFTLDSKSIDVDDALHRGLWVLSDTDIPMLHPPPEGVVTVSYKNLELAHFDRFCARVAVTNPKSKPVRFRFCLQDYAGYELFSLEAVVNGGGNDQVGATFVAKEEAMYRLSISTEMATAGDPNHYAWAVLQNMCFLGPT
ncbi:MAG: sulfotransferase [Usitatibacteraceae bacterium]